MPSLFFKIRSTTCWYREY